MNNLFLLVPRYLRRQQKRSALTALGIVLAVALITATGVLAASIQQMMIDQAVENTANYHGMITAVSPDQVAALREQAEIEVAGLASALGVHPLDNLFISLESFDSTTREMFNLNLVEGRYPEHAGEVALEKSVFEYLDVPAELGQTLALPFQYSYRDWQGQNQSHEAAADFTVVGILEDTGAKAAGASLGLVAQEMVEQLLPAQFIEYRGFVRVREGLAPEETLVRLAQSLGIVQEQIRWNGPLLRALGQGEELNWPIVTLAMVVVVATVATIYNAFHITVLERMRQFGLLRALGATGAQIRLLVLAEALLLALVALPLGLLLGIGAAAGVSRMLSLFNDLIEQIVVPGTLLAVASGLGLLSVLFSALIPALLAGQVPPLEAIQGRGQVLRGQGLRSRQGLTRHLGITAHMAYQNIWRNRRRSLVTVFSLGLGVILFLSFSAWAASTDAARLAQGLIAGDYSLAAQGIQSGVGFPAEVGRALEEMAGIEQVQSFQANYGVNLLVPEAEVAPEIVEMLPETPDLAQGTVLLPSLVMGYDEAGLSQAAPHLLEGEVDTHVLAGSPSLLLYDPKKTSSLSVGDKVNVQNVSHKHDQIVTTEQEFTIAGIVDELPLQPVAYPLGPVLLLHENQYQAFTGDTLYKRFDITLAPGADRQLIESRLELLAEATPQANLFSYEEEVAELQSQKQQMMTMAYSLVAVIAFIGTLNIVNTITTNMILRTREFGMLRAVGITSRQMQQMTRLEGLYYGLLGAAWSVPLGLALAYLLYHLLRQEMTYLVWNLPWQAALLAAVTCVVVGVAATLLPTRRLAHLQVVEALRTIV